MKSWPYKEISFEDCIEDFFEDLFKNQKDCRSNLQEWSSKQPFSAILKAIFKSCLWASLQERSSSTISKMISKRDLWANLQEWSSKQSSSLISKIISKRDLQKQSSQGKKDEQEKDAQIASNNEVFSQQITVIAASKPGI